MAKKSTKKAPAAKAKKAPAAKAPAAKAPAAKAKASTKAVAKAAPAASSKKAAAPAAPRMAGYVVLSRGKPLGLATGDDKPKNGVLERNERATLFTRLQGAQGAINRTAKHTEGKKGALTSDNCAIIRVDHLPTA